MSNIKQDIANRLLLIAIVLALCLFTTVGHAQTTPLHEAARTNNLDEITKLLKQGVDVNIKRGFGNDTPLHVAAINGSLEAVKILLAYGADIHVRNAHQNFRLGGSGGTPLHNAARIGSSSIVKILIDEYADINAQNIKDMTPLHWAASRGHIDTVKLLIENGANINLQDKYKKTPLDNAINFGYIDLARFMLSKGAKFGARNADLQHAGALDNIMTLEDMLRKLFPREKNTVSKIDIPLTGRIKTDYVFDVSGSSYAMGAYVFDYKINKKQDFLTINTRINKQGIELDIQKSKLIGNGKMYCSTLWFDVVALSADDKSIADIYVKRELSCGSAGCVYFFTYRDDRLLRETCNHEVCQMWKKNLSPASSFYIHPDLGLNCLQQRRENNDM